MTPHIGAPPRMIEDRPSGGHNEPIEDPRWADLNAPCSHPLAPPATASQWQS